MFAGGDSAKHDCLIVDTNAIIRGVHIERMAKELYTVPEVIAEIRDKQTREGVLNTLVVPEINVREPSPDAYDQVVAAAKESGDYPFLSEPDLKAVALTLTIFNERNPDATVPIEPEEPENKTEEKKEEEQYEKKDDGEKVKKEEKKKKKTRKRKLQKVYGVQD